MATPERAAILEAVARSWLKAQTTYTDGRGNRVNIVGPTWTLLGGKALFWSIEGEVYTGDGWIVVDTPIVEEGKPRRIERRTSHENTFNLLHVDESAAGKKFWETIGNS